ncbi:hypothetical protein NPIL_81381 [Nephila pilipes]|uniref:Uncharacterized protein n=1 Tax=Nephila pilipes TaxID=299642 RepID=A0A8X6Q828_NEPPI|nr:hypothetical protein NPIL_81381 [Nephila pilipes]
MPKRDGPIFIITQRFPTAYEVAHVAKPHVPMGYYQVSALKRRQDENSEPVVPLRKRSRPKTLDPNPNPSTTLRRSKRPKPVVLLTGLYIGTREEV